MCVSEKAVNVSNEVQHTDSVEAEIDKHSTSSSRGSTKWVSMRSSVPIIKFHCSEKPLNTPDNVYYLLF